MRVADLGCGVGMVTTLLAELVGPDGEVVGVDASGEQIARARELLPPGFSNVRFIEASATDTGLPADSFDLVYCRFLLLHLTEPSSTVEMHGLLRRDGILVCEDGDLTSAGSHPPSALDAFADLWGRLGPTRGLDYTLGRDLFRMIIAANFSESGDHLQSTGGGPRREQGFLEWSVAEAGPAFLAAGLVTHEDLFLLLADMQRISGG